MTLTAIVFSKDRPLQLDGCLRSLRAHATEGVDVRVVWRASAGRAHDAYAEVSDANPGAEWLTDAYGFESVVRDALAHAGPHVLFLVDDTIFVRPWSPERVTRQLDREEMAIGYSLRLGKNTTHCYPANRAQAVPEMTAVSSDGDQWFRWVEADGDFGYPIEVSSSVYRTADVLRWLDGRHFSNPNELEVVLAAAAAGAASATPMLLCGETSAAFSLPANRVQSQFPNRVGSAAGCTAEALLERWEQGMRMAIHMYADRVPTGCHEEAPLYLAHTAHAPAPKSLDMSRPPDTTLANQAAYAALYRYALVGMGYGAAGTDFDASGERWLLEEVGRRTEGRAAVVLDVGANRGEWARLAGRVLPRPTVFAFEPSETARPHIFEHAGSGASGTLVVYPFALSDHEGTATLHADRAGSGDASLHKRDLRHIGRTFDHEERVTVRPLDAVCRGAAIERIDLLKIDVEGAELDVLRGAESMLERGAIDVIQWEMGGTSVDARIFFRDFWHLLSGGYRIGRLVRDGIAWIDRYDEACEVFVGPTNFVAVRRG